MCKEVSGMLRKVWGYVLGVLGVYAWEADCNLKIFASRNSSFTPSSSRTPHLILTSPSHPILGVELLCLIGKAGDACRYLQSYGQWLASVWLAKCALPVSETVDILRRWAHHLVTTGNKV